MNVRRSMCLVAVAWILALPASAGAAPVRQSPASSPAAAQGIVWGALLGLEDGDGGAGLALRADGVLAYRTLAPKVRLSWVGSLGFTRFSDSTTVPVFGELEASSNVLKLLPAARFTFSVAPQFDLYADGAVGVYAAFVSIEVPDPTTGGVLEDDSTEFGVAMRFSGGGTYAVTPTFRIGAEIGLNPYFGDASDTTLSLLAAAQLRF